MSERTTKEQDEKFKLMIMKSTAIRQAMTEVVGEQRAEIVRRAKAKLVAMGVEVEDKDFEVEA